MENINLIISENLKRIRIGKGWSQSFVARQIGVAQKTISRAECGCGVSKRTLKRICGLYQIPVASVYDECVPEAVRSMQIVSEEVAVGLLIKNSFIQDLEQEIILRYINIIQKEALILRDDIELLIQEVLPKKKSYSFSEVVSACLVANQKTLSKIRQLEIA